MSTTAGAVLDIQHGAALRLAKSIEEMSGGRFRMEVFPGGQIMQPFDCFGAASQGAIEAFMASSYYWSAPGRVADREPAVDWLQPSRSG
jgi:TRAP-type mannitol/chloroaromatic compound transport system substrate-binding protein